MAPGRSPRNRAYRPAGNGQIPDPFYGSSQSDLQWIDKTDWEYCCTFDAPELASYDNVRLVFEGVDCYADIRLNGELLHRTGNMFRTWKSDVKGLLKSRNNRLHVVFHSPVMQGLKNMAAYGSRLTANNDLGALGGLGPNKVSVFTRKSGYQYGWDLAPRYVTSGLWRPVALEAWNEARVEDFHVRTRSTGPRKAQMSASAALRTDAAGCYRIRILLNGKSILTADKTLDAGTHSIEEPFEIPSPRLWYPNGMGEPYLYDVELVLEKRGGSLTARPSDAAYEPYRSAAATMRTAAAAVSASRSTASRYSAKAPTMCRPTRFCPGFRGRKRNFSCGAPPKPI